MIFKSIDNDERPTGKKTTTIEWDDGRKISNKSILILPVSSAINISRRKF